MNNEQYREYRKTSKWKEIARKRIEIDGNMCVMCGSRGSTANPLEVHHLTYRSLYHEEDRIYQDLATLCHACHKQVHNLMNRQTDANGRRGWKDNSSVPKVSVYMLNEETIEVKEVGKI